MDDVPLMAWAERVGEVVDAQPQGAVAAASALLGVVLSTHGAVLVRPLFAVVFAAWTGAEALKASQRIGSPPVAHWAPLIATCVALPTLKLWDHLYQPFTFVCGCLLGGSSIFFYMTLMAHQEDMAGVVGATVLAALLVGLSFMKFDGAYWSLLSPAAGGLLLASGVRYFASALLSADAHWTHFVHDMVKVDMSANEDSACRRRAAIFGLFWATWAIATMVGWFLQLSMLLRRSRQRESAATLSLEQICERLRKGALGKFAPSQAANDREEANVGKEPLLNTSVSEEPWLPHRSGGVSQAASSTFGPAEGSVVSKEVSSVFDVSADYRPEFALLVAISSVVGLNWLLRTQALLFVGHAVLMSVAFLPLATAGLVSYASTNKLLPRIFGPQFGSDAASRQLTQAVFDGLAMACAFGGLNCMWEHNRRMGHSQLGFGSDATAARVCHVFMGYGVLALLVAQACRGMLRMFSEVTGSKKFAGMQPSHRLGRGIYCLAALTQLIAYTFQGLLPEWATPILSAMLIFTVGNTLFWLNERARMKTAARRLEIERAMQISEQSAQAELGRAKLLKEVDAVSTQSSIPRHDSSVIQRMSGSEFRFSTPLRASIGMLGSLHTSSSAKQIEALQAKLAQHAQKELFRDVFSAWHRQARSARLESSTAEIEGQERLVEFLSQALSNQEGFNETTAPQGGYVARQCSA